MGKAGKIILGILVILIILVIIFYFYVSKSPTPAAMLNIESGNVQVNKGSGFVDAVDEMKLKKDWSIKTSENGIASIILYQSAVITLDPNTEVKIDSLLKENIALKQSSGSIWSKFTGLMGLTGMSIETPETVATVRGTSFGVKMKGIIVGEGKVRVSKGDKVEEVEEGEAVDWSIEGFVKRVQTPEEKAEVIEKIKKHIEIMKKIRINEINQKRFVVEKIMAANNLDYNKLEEYLNTLDSNDMDLKEISAKIPIKLDSAEKVIGLTEKIRKEIKFVEKLSGVNSLTR